MYHPHTTTVTGAAGTLAATGANSMWLALAAFTLTMAGCAVLRLVPRRAK